MYSQNKKISLVNGMLSFFIGNVQLEFLHNKLSDLIMSYNKSRNLFEQFKKRVGNK
jgi:hypothetical protein